MEKIDARELTGPGAKSQLMVASLSRLNEGSNNVSDEYHINVFEKQQDWLKVVVNNTGRALWVQIREPFKFVGWKEYFAERSVRMKSGLPSEYYVVSTSNGKEKLGVVSPQDTMTVISVVEDWAMVRSDKLQKGWLRWRNLERQLLFDILE